MRFELQTFKGTAPAIDGTRLAAGMATVAENCRVDKGVLQSEQGLTHYRDKAISGTVQTLYRYSGNSDINTGYLFEFDSAVSVVKAPLPENTSDIVLIVGDGYPKITDNSLALASAPYPSNTYRLGVPQPTSAPSVVTQGTAEANANINDRDYVVTFLTQIGALVMEGKPCSPSVPVQIGAGQHCQLGSLPQPPSGDYNFTGKRLYRRTNYGGAGSFQLVAELATSASDFTDNLQDTEIPGDVLATTALDADMPPETMTDLVALPNGLCAGSDGVAVHVSHAYQVHSWGAFNRYATKHPIVGLGQFDNTIVACTEKNPVLITGTSASSMYAQELQLHQGCLSKQSIVSGPFGVVYASPDGLVIISAQGMDVATGDVIDRDEWQQLNPSSIKACLWEGAYLGAYTKTDNSRGLFLFDPRRREQGLLFYSMAVDALFNDALADTVLIHSNGATYSFGTGTKLSLRWRSGVTLTDPVKLNSCRIRKDGTFTFRLIRDGVQVLEIAVPDKAFRLPAGRGEKWQVELEGTGKVYSVTMASSMSEV